jgi:hypothetical protein
MDSQEAEKTNWEANLERMKPCRLSLWKKDEIRHTVAVIISHTPVCTLSSIHADLEHKV